MNEEILSGLRISLERGFTLDSAVQSFLNAGYNPAEVNEAAAALVRPVSSSLTQLSPRIPVQPLPKTPQILEVPPVAQEAKPAASPKMKLLLIIAIIIILLLIIGAIGTLLFKDQIISFFTNTPATNA